MAARPLRRVNSAPGRRSARSRRQPAMRLPGRSPGTDHYTVWNTDSNGNYLSNIGHVSGTSAALESLETSFHQDLNGDGVIGVPDDGDRILWLDQPGRGGKQFFPG